jgi:hypothetical protein
MSSTSPIAAEILESSPPAHRPAAPSIKLTSQIRSLTSLIPRFCPAKTVLRLILYADPSALGDGDGLVMEGVLEVR